MDIHEAPTLRDDSTDVLVPGNVVTVEDHNPKTGLGTWIQARLNDLGLSARVWKMGVSFYSSSGPAKELYALMGLDGPAIVTTVREALSGKR